MESLHTSRQVAQKVKHLGILISDDREVRHLNKVYRNLDKTTDVLSFSMTESKTEYHDNIELGDIVISLDMAVKQSKRFKVTLSNEIMRLLIHGCLHLFGYDHVRVSKKRVKAMKDLEDLLFDRYAFKKTSVNWEGKR